MDDHHHLSRSQYHREIGLAIADTSRGHPWGCVVVFYAAYHLARWGLQCDARFNDLGVLKSINRHFTPDLRFTAKHKASTEDRNAGRRFGVNDLVAALYPAAAPAYETLHQASIEVRYNQGRAAALPTPDRLEVLLDTVHKEIAAEVLKP